MKEKELTFKAFFFNNFKLVSYQYKLDLDCYVIPGLSFSLGIVMNSLTAILLLRQPAEKQSLNISFQTT
jgi:hypothetical protein